jgi:hypothetical protein
MPSFSQPVAKDTCRTHREIPLIEKRIPSQHEHAHDPILERIRTSTGGLLEMLRRFFDPSLGCQVTPGIHAAVPKKKDCPLSKSAQSFFRGRN